MTSGAAYQNEAVSVSKTSLTTSQGTVRSALRWRRPFNDVAGFWPMQSIPFTLPSAIRIIIGMCE